MRPIHAIAQDIKKNWSNVNYAAKPYLDAMFSLSNKTDDYGHNTAESVILYFLSNASSYRGDVAKLHKAELKEIAGIKMTKKERDLLLI